MASDCGNFALFLWVCGEAESLLWNKDAHLMASLKERERKGERERERKLDPQYSLPRHTPMT
jgi:hypothetical protein